jgi:hypothetical protein
MMLNAAQMHQETGQGTGLIIEGTSHPFKALDSTAMVFSLHGLKKAAEALCVPKPRRIPSIPSIFVLYKKRAASPGLVPLVPVLLAVVLFNLFTASTQAEWITAPSWMHNTDKDHRKEKLLRSCSLAALGFQAVSCPQS